MRLALLLMLLCSAPLHAAQPINKPSTDPIAGHIAEQLVERSIGPELRVGLRVTAPFVIADSSGDQPRYSGIAVELWEAVAAQNGWRYQYQPLPLRTLFDQLEAGELDLAVGALSVTGAREQRVDFSQPYFTDGLGIAVRSESGLSFRALLQRLWKGGFLGWIAGLITLLACVGILAWLLERRGNAEQFGGRPIEGIGSGFWWAAVTMSTVGYGDKAPATLGGRILALIWMFTAIILVSIFTAGVTASLTVGALEGRVQNAADLPRVRVATVADSTADQWLQRAGITAQRSPQTEHALQLLAAGEVDAVVADGAVLRYQIRRDPMAQPLAVLADRLQPQRYAFALRQGQSAKQEALNRALLTTLESDVWQARLRTLLGEDR